MAAGNRGHHVPYTLPPSVAGVKRRIGDDIEMAIAWRVRRRGAKGEARWCDVGDVRRGTSFVARRPRCPRGCIVTEPFSQPPF